MADEPKSQPSNYYIDPAAFTKEIVAYREHCAAFKELGNPTPKIPSGIAEKLTLLARRLSFSPKFRNYTYRDEMIQDGLEDCIRYFHNFNPTKGSPFSYFTQILYYAYVGRIQTEKKQKYIHHKMIKRSMPVEGIAAYNDGEDGDHSIEIEFDQENIDDFISKYEEMLDRKRKKKDIVQEGPLDLLIGEEVDVDRVG